MIGIHGRIQRWHGLCLLLLLLPAVGCHSAARHPKNPAFGVDRLPPVYETMPRELSKVALPEYVIEPPDILMIEGIHIVPKAPYRLRTLDVLSIQVSGALPEAQISGMYPVEPGGSLNLGADYGTVQVAGMTVEEAQEAIYEHLGKYLTSPGVSVALAQMAASQQILGDFLVQPDGQITLGGYGNVSIVGTTLAQAKEAIETHLKNYLDEPEVAVSVQAFNSKVYYIVMQGAGLGDGIFKYPITGNETVLDAISNVQGLEQVSSKKIWVARPTNDPCQVQILPVDYFAVTERASPHTNYQIMPGDRVFIAEDKLIAWDTQIAKVTAPLERIMGFTLLGVGVGTRLSGRVLTGGGNRNNAGI
ncbi:MAG: polysaccharide biosynthesis/export family protein [Pirellulaceae bacterium]|nr:polysaccharide biosynthesis/export family protein [Pirellulaceae bacterium]